MRRGTRCSFSDSMIRELKSILGDASVVKDICAEGKTITIFLGDLVNEIGDFTPDKMVSAEDLSYILGRIGTNEPDGDLETRDDFCISSTAGLKAVEFDDLSIILKN